MRLPLVLGALVLLTYALTAGLGFTASNDIPESSADWQQLPP